jgi:hypothetical protein
MILLEKILAMPKYFVLHLKKFDLIHNIVRPKI